MIKQAKCKRVPGTAFQRSGAIAIGRSLWAIRRALPLVLLALNGLARAGAAPVEAVAIEGLRAAAEIRIDQWGVPHIRAASQRDLFFVQGWNAARDRLFQIDLWRRRGLGQLAEVFGAGYVEQDKATRLFLYRGDMEQEWRSYSGKGTLEPKSVAEAFVAGINAYVDRVNADPEKLPWEFKRFDYRPARWSAEDVVRIRSHGLTRNVLSEVARARTACNASLADDALRFGLQPEVVPEWPEGLDPCLPGAVLKVFQLATQAVRIDAVAVKRGDIAALLALTDDTDRIEEGSNNWVVAPSRSSTGRPILANDPHRAYTLPSLRYLVHLRAPGLNAIGAGEPSLPGISIGHNATIAFGLTIFNIDQEDLYVYELNPANLAEYRYQKGWEPMRLLKEEIQVRDGLPVEVTLRFTRHGPIIYTDQLKNRAYAVRAAWLETGMAPYFGAIDYMRASNFEQFRSAMLNWGAPSENQVYADIHGTIGLVPGGRAPKRPNWYGLTPVPGDGRYEWAGSWRGDALPWLRNPRSGWIATANAYNLPDRYPARERKLGFEWTNPSRAARVHEVLGKLPKISLIDTIALQNDILSIPARRLIALLSTVGDDDAAIAPALAMLKGWDAVESADSPAAALFEVWQANYLRKAFRVAWLGPAAAEVLPGTDLRVMLALLENPDALRLKWGVDFGEKRAEVLSSSLAKAWADMHQRQGSSPSQWRWGDLHQNVLEHPFSPALDDGTRRHVNLAPIATGGSEYTPNQAAYRSADFRQTNGPSFRIAMDVGAWDNSLAVNHPGQSGDPQSPHYRDLASMWSGGRYFPLAYSERAVRAVTERVLRLRPDTLPRMTKR
jgi:penicillin amidase